MQALGKISGQIISYMCAKALDRIEEERPKAFEESVQEMFEYLRGQQKFDRKFSFGLLGRKTDKNLYTEAKKNRHWRKLCAI